MSWLRDPRSWVFVILLVSSGYFWQSRDWNVASRLMLTYAIVDRGTLTIDGFEDQTRDIARYQGHFYSDKTPGLSILAVIPYATTRWGFGGPPHPLHQPGFAHWPADYWATLGTSGLFTALTGAWLVGLARDLGCGPRRAALVGLTYGLATPAFAYATLAYGHQAAGFGLLASFALLWRETARPRLRAGLAGFLASFASVVEIQVGPVSALLGLYAVALAVGRRRPLGTIASFALGALPPTLVLLGYNTLAFGSPWRMGYFFEVLDRFKEVHSSSNPLGMGRPDWSRLDDLLWGERRGLVWFAPIVGLTIPGLVTLGRRRFWGMLSVVTGTIGSVVLVNLCYPEWTGGWSTGPRLLVPMLPFALIPVAAWLAPGGRLRVTLAGLLALAGALVILAYVAVGARVPDAVGRPWVEGVWPLLSGVRPLPGWVFGTPYARNLTTLVFPDLLKALPRWAGWATVLPLVALQGVMIAGMLRVVREPDLKRS